VPIIHRTKKVHAWAPLYIKINKYNIKTCIKIHVVKKDPPLVFNVVKNLEKYIGHEKSTFGL